MDIYIYGGNVQICQKDSHAIQNNDGDMDNSYSPKNSCRQATETKVTETACGKGLQTIVKISTEKGMVEEPFPLSPEKRVKLHEYLKTDEWVDYYSRLLFNCKKAHDIACVAMDMFLNGFIEKSILVKANFIRELQPLCPQVKTGTSTGNIRYQINSVLEEEHLV